jgi:ribonuclease HI
MTSWIYSWLKNNWLNNRKQEVVNKDLWEMLLKLSKGHEIVWEWVRGHNAHTENERCDNLARLAIPKCKKG